MKWRFFYLLITLLIFYTIMDVVGIETNVNYWWGFVGGSIINGIYVMLVFLEEEYN